MSEILDILQQLCGSAVQTGLTWTVSAQAQAGAAGPRGLLDLLLVGVGIVVVVLVGVYTVKLLVRPRERDPRHIKHRILRDHF